MQQWLIHLWANTAYDFDQVLEDWVNLVPLEESDAPSEACLEIAQISHSITTGTSDTGEEMIFYSAVALVQTCRGEAT